MTIVKFLGLGLFLWGQSEPTAEDIEQLVRDLGSPRFEERESAHERLLRIGPAARASLESAVGGDDVERGLRAEAILREIDREQLWAPSRLQIREENLSVLKLLEQVSVQTGNPINWTRTPQTIGGLITVDWNGTPFWEAMDTICRTSHLRIDHSDDPQRLGMVLAHGDPGRYPTAYDGPLRLRLTQIRHALSENLELGEPNLDRQQTVSINALLDWEQRLPICRFVPQARLVEAVTDTGEDLRRPQSPQSNWLPLYRRKLHLTYTLPLAAPARPAQRLERLVLDTELECAGDFICLETTRFEPGVVAEAAGYVLTLVSISQGPGKAQELVIKLDRPIELDRPNSTELPDEYVEVLDAVGNPIRFSQREVTGTRTSAQYKLYIPPTAEPAARVRYHIGLLRGRRTARFVLRDIPIALFSFQANPSRPQ